MKLQRICDWLISFSFSTLFFLVPLILTPFNYELFEYNKMMLVYALTITITGAWLIKMVVHKRFVFQRTPFDLPIFLFLISQILSFIFSMDRHVSLFGYYSRFNGGLFSVFSYLLLYYALVSNINKDQVLRFLKLSLLSALVVSLYGIMEHFGIDKNLWVQDVQNRVFSTLGQPNWLGAYLAILIPITIGINFSFVIPSTVEGSRPQPRFARFLHSLRSVRMTKKTAFYYLLSATFYLCLLYTKSRSGLLGLGVAFGVFVILSLWKYSSNEVRSLRSKFSLRSNNIIQPLLLLSGLFFLLSIFVGTPFTPSLSSIIYHPSSVPAPTGPALETGGTESGEIRKIVWSGAIDIARHYPLFGTGPETFAFAYYQFRPVAHNLVSEWDFLYNKAHNEYLNYAATTGFVGLGTYLLFIGWFIVWSLKKIFSYFVIPSEVPMSHRDESRDLGRSRASLDFPPQRDPACLAVTSTRPSGLVGMTFFLFLALFAGWLSILVTNFFGFSVVIISLYFWLIPAMVIIITKNDRHAEFISASVTLEKRILNQVQDDGKLRMTGIQYFAFSVILLFTFYFLLSLVRFWYADVRFNRGYQLSHAGYYQQAYQPFHEAIDVNPQEPFYRDELSYADAVLSVAALQQKDATLSAQLAQEAVFENQKALSISPQNVNFYKTQTKVYYTLATLDPNSTIFNQKALQSLQKAKNLAPTDPKITYNIALLLGRLGKNQEAIKTLEEAVALKSNYQDARFALALFEHEAGKKKEAITQLEYILKYLSPTDKQIQEKLKEWGNL